MPGHLERAAAGARDLHREGDGGASLAPGSDELRLVRRPGEHVFSEGDLGHRQRSYPINLTSTSSSTIDRRSTTLRIDEPDVALPGSGVDWSAGLADSEAAVRIDVVDGPPVLWFPRADLAPGALDGLDAGAWRSGDRRPG